MPHYETPTHELQQTIIPHCFPHEAQPPSYYRSRPVGRAVTAGFVRYRSLHQPVKHSFAPPGQINPYLLIDLQ